MVKLRTSREATRYEEADWTDTRSEQGREIGRALNTIRNAGIPTQAIYHPAEPDEPIVLRDHISPEKLHAALRQAAALSRLD